MLANDLKKIAQSVINEDTQKTIAAIKTEAQVRASMGTLSLEWILNPTDDKLVICEELRKEGFLCSIHFRIKEWGVSKTHRIIYISWQ